MLDGMTNVKASEVLKELKMYSEYLPHYSPDEVAEALEMGSKALEQQTVEDCVSREELYKALDELNTICGTGMVEKAVTENNIYWLKWKIDKLLSDALKEAYVRGYDYGVKDWFKAKTQPCEDAVSREAVRQLIEADKVDMKASYIDSVATDVQKMCFNTLNQACDRHIEGINSLLSVTPSNEALKEAYDKGFEYGVKDWFKAKTDKPDIKAEIIKRIEQVRDNDKNVGEYPYNRCIKIIREVLNEG